MADEQPFPANAVNVLRTAQQINVQLSAMADQKASILMGAAFVIFTIAINQAHGTLPPLPLLILGASAFVAAACAVLAIMPAVGTRPRGPANLLFFGVFAQLGEEEFTEAMLEILRSDEASYRAMLRDMHQNGLVLARKKYRMLAWAYRSLLAGMTASLVAFVAERLI
jgi:pycsar effector protein